VLRPRSLLRNYKPPFGKSDHNSIVLIPAYKQKHKQEVPVTYPIQKWSDDAKIHNFFARTDWNMYQNLSDGIEEFITSGTGFINECIDNVIPTVTLRIKIRSDRLWATSPLS
jgi:hypothetical protein